MQLHTIFMMMGQGQEGGGGTSFFLFLGLFFVIIYFFMIRPQSKKAKEQKNFLAEIKKGDRVVTIGGIHGKIVGEDEFTFLLEVDSNAKIRIEKGVISLEFTKALRERMNSNAGKDKK